MPTRSKVRHYRSPSRLAEYAAPLLHMQPGSVEQLIHGHTPIQERFAILVRAAIALGDHEMYHRLMGPTEMVIDGVEMPEPDAEHRADLADAEEDRAQAEYRAHPSPETARALLKARHRDRASSTVHDKAIAEKWGLTPESEQ